MTPTQAEIRKLLLEADLKMKAAVAVLAISGIRIGELCALRIGNINLEKKPTQITIPAHKTKTRQSRIVRISDRARMLVGSGCSSFPRQLQELCRPN